MSQLVKLLMWELIFAQTKKDLQSSSVILFNLVLVYIRDRFLPHAISYEFRLIFYTNVKTSSLGWVYLISTCSSLTLMYRYSI